MAEIGLREENSRDDPKNNSPLCIKGFCLDPLQKKIESVEKSAVEGGEAIFLLYCHRLAGACNRVSDTYLWT
jgi:hypothetical protein